MSRETESFILLSINHETASLAERERFSVDDANVRTLYQRLKDSPQIDEALVLNTCNRFELYAQLGSGALPDHLTALLAEFYGYSPSEVAAHVRLRHGLDAVQHLIEVAAGLRSQITGEAEIFGQVKNAYALCLDQGRAGKVINRVFQKGFQAAKLIRNSTQIGEGQINIANVAVELASKIFGSLERAAALSLGTGEIGEKTVKALRSRGAADFGIVSRSPDRAAAVAQDWGGRPHSLADLGKYLPFYDIVIASIGSEEPVVTRELVKSALARRKDRPLFLIDLGLPRNVQPTCGHLDNVFLYNLDDLAAIAEENLAERRAALAASQEIAAQKAATIWQSIVTRNLSA